VIAAAIGVFGTAQGWPDAVVAAILAALAMSGGIAVMRHARDEMRPAMPGAQPTRGRKIKAA